VREKRGESGEKQFAREEVLGKRGTLSIQRDRVTDRFFAGLGRFEGQQKGKS